LRKLIEDAFLEVALVENAPFESHNVETRLMEQASTVDSFIED
jgi:hypothetical protein